jgi:hypothetical protein
MEYPRNHNPGASGHSADEWAETLARTIAHLAAQLTMSQIRLRALATALGEVQAVDERRVSELLSQIAARETGSYLRENLGDALADLVDTEALEREIVSFLQS